MAFSMGGVEIKTEKNGFDNDPEGISDKEMIHSRKLQSFCLNSDGRLISPNTKIQNIRSTFPTERVWKRVKEWHNVIFMKEWMKALEKARSLEVMAVWSWNSYASNFHHYNNSFCSIDLTNRLLRYSLNAFCCLCVCLFVGQVMSPHHSDQMSQMSQVN